MASATESNTATIRQHIARIKAIHDEIEALQSELRELYNTVDLETRSLGNRFLVGNEIVTIHRASQGYPVIYFEELPLLCQLSRHGE